MTTNSQIALLQIDLCLELLPYDDQSPRKWADQQTALLEIREELELQTAMDLTLYHKRKN